MAFRPEARPGFSQKRRGCHYSTPLVVVGRQVNAGMSVNVAELSSAEGHDRPGHRGRAEWVASALALGIVFCLVSCALAGVLAVGSRRSAGGLFQFVSAPMKICAGAVTQPRFQIGVGWQSQIMSVMPPAVVLSHSAACLNTRWWPAAVPVRGEWMFPP